MDQRISLLTTLLVVLFTTLVSAQVDTTKTVPEDTSVVQPVMADTVPVVTDTVPPASTQDTLAEAKSKKERKPYDKLKIGAGISFGKVDGAQTYSSEDRLGYLFSFAYHRGRFFYLVAGVEYISNRIELTEEASGTLDDFTVSTIDVPLSVGINLLSAVDRVVGLRAFAGATPAVVIGVGENDLDIGRGDTNSFNAYVHAGIGVNVIFLYVDAVYKYGVTDFFEGFSSQPRQFQVKLGFRF